VIWSSVSFLMLSLVLIVMFLPFVQWIGWTTGW
jgi:hypothetical protein